MNQNKNRYHASAAKDTLARLLASENLQVRRDKRLKTASMDTINRILYLPVWDEKNLSQTVQDGLIGHEVGHALYTPAEGLEEFAAKLVPAYFKANKQKICWIANCLEDSRIERLMKKRFPGLARVMHEGYRELWEDNFFGVKGQDLKTLTFLDRIHLHCKMGAGFMVPFNTPKELELVQKVESTETVEDVIRVAREICEYLPKKKVQKKENQESKEEEKSQSEEPEKDETEEQPSKTPESENENDESPSDPETDDESDNESNKDEEDGEEEDESSDNSAPGTSDELTEEDSKDGSEDGDTGEGSDAGDEKMTDSDAAEGEAENAPDKIASEKSEEKGEENKEQEVSEEEDNDALGQTLDNLKNSLENAAQTSKDLETTGFAYIDMPRPSFDLETVIRPFKQALNLLEYGWSVAEREGRTQAPDFAEIAQREFQDFYKSQSPVINQMVADFETRKAATEHVRAEETKTGTLDMNRLHQAAFNDDIFQKLTTVPQGKNHGLVMFIDWSGSMSSQLANTINQLLNLVWFCRKLNIPFDVYSFAQHNNAPRDLNPNSRPGSEFNIRDLTLTNLLSSRGNKKDLDRAMFLLSFAGHNQSPMGITPGHKYEDFFSNDAMAHVDAKGTLSLTGTPLYQTLAIMPNVIAAFQKASRVEIVHAVVLSDGEPTDSFSSNERLKMDAFGNYVGFRKGEEVILRDPVTCTEINLNLSQYMKGSGATRALIRMTRTRLKGCNVIGFFIKEQREAFRGWGSVRKQELSIETQELTALQNQGLSSTEARKVRTDMKAEGFATVKETCGYSEYYIIYSSALRVNSSTQFQINEEDSKRKMIDTFAEHVTKHKASRVFLRKFVQQVVAQGVV